jgi:NADH-quinone oxidoreductase subunit N
MTASTLSAIGPLVALAVAVLVVMIALAIHRSRSLTFALTLAGLAAAAVTLRHAPMAPAIDAVSLVVFDAAACFYTGLILAATAAIAVLAFGDAEWQGERPEEINLLLLLAALGSVVLVAAVHFVALFLGLEILSVSLYALIAYPRTRAASLEAGVKYLVLAAGSAAFLLFGMALVYAETGTMAFAGLTPMPSGADATVTLAGVGLIVVGIGFKLALVPFHLWTPDVYEGAPAPVAAFIATVSKGAVLALLVRYAAIIDVGSHPSLFMTFAVLAVASMVAGNVLALLQDNVKRLLAYSSIAHLGYLIVAFLAGGALASTAIAFYLSAYFVTMIGAFGVVTVLSRKDAAGTGSLDEYRGLALRRPWIATVFAAMLLSLAGIPLTAGFVGKLYVTVAAGGAALWTLLVVMMLTSGLGLFYYLRVIVAMFMQPADGAAATVAVVRVPVAASLTLAALAVALVWLGVYPGPFIQIIRATVGGG